MYNPSRGGVRGGADQFTWENVKTDKHRENYLGHSLKAPVGRWQKGKDLSWYAKERKDNEDAKNADKSELAAIKRAEQEAMLIALGHNVIKKENQSLSKEEMTEALKRNIGDRDQLNIERVDGVGAKSGRVALLARSKNEGVTFETHKDRAVPNEGSKEDFPSDRRSKNKKKSKKHKKEKKKRSHKKGDSDYSENDLPSKRENKNDRPKRDHNADDSEDESSFKRRHKKGRNKRRDELSDSEIYRDKSTSKRKHTNEETNKRHMAEKSNDSEDELSQSNKQRKEQKRGDDTSDSDELSSSNSNKWKKKEKINKKHNNISDDGYDNHSKTRKEQKYFNASKYGNKSKYGHQNSDDSENEYRKEKYKNRSHELDIKRRRHDSSESD